MQPLGNFQPHRTAFSFNRLSTTERIASEEDRRELSNSLLNNPSIRLETMRNSSSRSTINVSERIQNVPVDEGSKPENEASMPFFSTNIEPSFENNDQIDIGIDGNIYIDRFQERFLQNLKRQYPYLIYWVFMLLFAIFLCYYFYEVLVIPQPRLGKLEPEPGNTNIIVAVLAQIFGVLMLSLYLDLFDALQVKLLSERKGSLLLEAMQLSKATGLFGTLRMCFIPGRHQIWTFLRITLPTTAIVLGNILKFRAGLIYEIATFGEAIQVWAGLAEWNPDVLTHIPTSVMAIYFLAWTPSLLGVPQFVSTLPSSNNCTNQCDTYILPGGIEIARLWGANLNETLLEQEYFNQSDVLQIYNAPGIVIEFEQPIQNTQFDPSECELYGPIRGDAINICMKPTELGTAIIGWRICPTIYYKYNVNSTCISDVDWTEILGQVTKISTYRQFTTTSYSRQNLSILNITPIGSRKALPINPDNFKSIWGKIFGQNASMPPISNSDNSTSITDDSIMVDSFMFELGWYLRLYEDQFHEDQQSPINLLRNFLTMPIQFYTTALQYWNATTSGGDAPMPGNMQTTALAAQGHWRWKAPLWTLIVWMVIVAAFIFVSGMILFWILFQDTIPFKHTSFPPLDIVSIAGVGCQITGNRITLADLAFTEKLMEKNTFEIVNALRGKRGFLIQAQCHNHHKTHWVFVISKEEV